MEKTLKILAAVTGVLVAIGEVISQANKYLTTKKELATVTTKPENDTKETENCSADNCE